MNKSIYTIPKLCKAKNGWYVHFRYNGVQKRHNVANKEQNLSFSAKKPNTFFKKVGFYACPGCPQGNT